MKRRLEKLKNAIIGEEPQVIVFCTLYEDRNGDVESEYARGTIIWAKGQSASMCGEEGESCEAFGLRMKQLAKLTFAEAQKHPEVKTHQSHGHR